MRHVSGRRRRGVRRDTSASDDDAAAGAVVVNAGQRGVGVVVRVRVRVSVSVSVRWLTMRRRPNSAATMTCPQRVRQCGQHAGVTQHSV